MHMGHCRLQRVVGSTYTLPSRGSSGRIVSPSAVSRNRISSRGPSPIRRSCSSERVIRPAPSNLDVVRFTSTPRIRGEHDSAANREHKPGHTRRKRTPSIDLAQPRRRAATPVAVSARCVTPRRVLNPLMTGPGLPSRPCPWAWRGQRDDLRLFVTTIRWPATWRRFRQDSSQSRPPGGTWPAP
jgi:hypothetical protein